MAVDRPGPIPSWRDEIWPPDLQIRPQRRRIRPSAAAPRRRWMEWRGSQSSAWEGEEGASGSRSSVPPLAAATARQWAATAAGRKAGREALGPRQGRPPSRPVEDAREGAAGLWSLFGN